MAWHKAEKAVTKISTVQGIKAQNCIKAARAEGYSGQHQRYKQTSKQL
jgi:hypothetical protein